MAFITGARQVGKTTTCLSQKGKYLDWDNINDRQIISGGPAKIAKLLALDTLSEKTPKVIFDELHKFNRWKTLLKGFFDTYSQQVKIMVTGSSRLDAYRKGGDSLMGRYFLYRMHPFTVAETVITTLPDTKKIIREPRKIKDAEFLALYTHGGFPEPFLKRDMRFTRRWQKLRSQQLIKEDIRDLTRIQQITQLEMMVNILTNRSSEQLIYSNLARELQISVDTTKRWIDTLCNLHAGFTIKPWFKNVSRSLRKEPKWFMKDWSVVNDPGNKCETFIACHLLKAVQGWSDLGYPK